MPTLKLATFNINNVVRRLPVLLQWLEKASPDIVCLQELKAADHAFPAAALQELGYQAKWVGQVAWNGVAILAKGSSPVEVRRALPGDPSDTQSRYLEAAVQGILIGCLYDSGHPVVLMGDYNVVPTDFDIYDTRSWRKNALLQPAPRAQYQRLLAQGWVDCLRELHPSERIYTFWDYFRDHWSRNAGLRLDHVLLSAALAPRLVDAGVDSWVRGLPEASDHAPVWVTLKRTRKLA
jgi:exodeoxyribonuclease-3